MNLKNLIDDLKISVESRDELRRIADLPEVQHALAAQHDRHLAHRVELRKRLTLVPAQHRRAQEDAGKAAAAANAKVRDLAESLRLAKLAEAAANTANYAASLQNRTAECSILNELYEGRDLRLDDLRRQVDRAQDAVRNSDRLWIESGKDEFGAAVRYGSNLHLCLATNGALLGLLDEVHGLCHDAISRDEITSKMRGICYRAQVALDPLHIVGPTIDEHGEVKDPAPCRVADQHEVA